MNEIETESKPLPEQIAEAPEYDASNPDHVRRWELAGRPAIDVPDSDGNFWRPTITLELQKDGSYLAIPAPEGPAPVTDVETASRALATRRQTREDVIFSDTAGLVATCYAWLQRECTVPGGGNDKKTASQALQAGQGLCSTTGYGVALRAWIDFAAPDFYQAMSSPDEARPWLEWVPAGEAKSIREAILDRVHLATYGVARK